MRVVTHLRIGRTELSGFQVEQMMSLDMLPPPKAISLSCNGGERNEVILPMACLGHGSRIDRKLEGGFN